jgi:hypothetical protein
MVAASGNRESHHIADAGFEHFAEDVDRQGVMVSICCLIAAPDRGFWAFQAGRQFG